MNVIPLQRNLSGCAAAVRALATAEVWDAINERCGGFCEMCETGPAIELHHLTYAPVDPAKALENLFALCGPCHAPKHGNEN